MNSAAFYRLEQPATNDFEQATRLEWLETNGLGGWASASISGALTRRYHGLLVTATHPPVGRMVLLSKLDETIVLGEQRFQLGCNQFPNAIYPRGFEYLRSFERGLFPEFVYEAGSIRIRKTIAALNGENTTLVIYEVLQSDQEFVLELQPFVAGRDYHGLTRANGSIDREAHFDGALFRTQLYPGLPSLFIAVPGATFEHQPEWYYNFEYAIEQERGLDFHEDLFTHGRFIVKLHEGQKLGIIISTENPSGRNALQLFTMEQRRREKVVAAVPARNSLLPALLLAADQFVVKRGDDLRTIIAGYHWFSDWGRDTMIAFPGLCLATGRFEDAKKILRAFAQSVSQGMLPNRFPDAGEQPEFNTVDATLWFFIAIFKYLNYTEDEAFVRDELLQVLRDIIDWHERGTRYNIHVDTDGLLYAGEPGVQLTWMDAKIGDWVVTPRQGKAVEINALWYNALTIYATLCERFNQRKTAEDFRRKARLVKDSFLTRFWNDSSQCLFDYVDGDHRDPAIRPNQLFAISLPFVLLDDQKARRVLAVVEEQLLTPYGLRSLAPDNSDYRATYGGNQWSRDSAYHQGTVWSWLLGPFITALVRYKGESGRQQAEEILEQFSTHLSQAGIGTISEIFDADPPHAPRGCIAQAWSVGELLRVLVEDLSKPSANRVVQPEKNRQAKTLTHNLNRKLVVAQ